ncbi:MAG: hypothetical protein L3I99_07805 [Sulfurimonas sp.]|nr:hypothetical protein [Sulfurimonas sp.]
MHPFFSLSPVAGTVLVGTELKEWVYDVTYNKLVAFEEFDIYSSEITGTATKINCNTTK